MSYIKFGLIYVTELRNIGYTECAYIGTNRSNIAYEKKISIISHVHFVNKNFKFRSS